MEVGAEQTTVTEDEEETGCGREALGSLPTVRVTLVSPRPRHRAV